MVVHALDTIPGERERCSTFIEFLLCTTSSAPFNPQRTLGSNSCRPVVQGRERRRRQGQRAQLVWDEPAQSPVLATPKPSTWRAVEVRHWLRRLGAARVLRESPAATSPSVLVASLPGPPRAAGGSLAQPPRWPFLHLGYVRLVTCQERETDLLPGHSPAMAWGLCELTVPPPMAPFRVPVEGGIRLPDKIQDTHLNLDFT